MSCALGYNRQSSKGMSGSAIGIPFFLFLMASGSVNGQ